jgi:tetraacyldisaccharide 4'-kinase
MTAGEAGDEPFMLAEKIPGLMVVVGADRYRAGLLALERFNPDLFILDDGFQHMRLHRDLNILLLDNKRPFGNGRVFPGGLLREPRSAARRADLIIYTRCGKSDTGRHSGGIPCCGSTHELAGVVTSTGGEIEPLANLAGMRGVAFAGIAEPGAFFSMLDNVGLNIVSKIAFPDHSRYENAELADIKAVFKGVNGDYLITTEKDLVKLAPWRDEPDKVYAAVLEVKVQEARPLTAMIEKLLQV